MTSFLYFLVCGCGKHAVEQPTCARFLSDSGISMIKSLHTCLLILTGKLTPRVIDITERESSKSRVDDVTRTWRDVFITLHCRTLTLLFCYVVFSVVDTESTVTVGMYFVTIVCLVWPEFCFISRKYYDSNVCCSRVFVRI